LADPSNNDSLTSELESRLDDLFREDDAPEPVEIEPQAQGYPLAELKNLVLSIDWEITDKVLADFVSQVKVLKANFQDDKIVLMFLQILGSLGEYIKTNRGKAHPKTFKTLNSVFARLDEVVRSKGMSETEKKKILHTAMKRYKLLRQRISKEKVVPGRQKKIAMAKKAKPPIQKQPTEAEVAAVPSPGETVESVQPEPIASELKSAISANALAEAVNEIKAYIHAEIDNLREELKQLKK
jgi:hypothetical protein